MRELTVVGADGRRSRILVGESPAALPRYLPERGVVIITDPTVFSHHGDRFPEAPVLTVGTGEGIKTLDTVRDLYGRLMAFEADRSAFLVGIGGGIVCDITGFVAATYLRGVRFGFVASTLLAQVDASVGGKNGVNVDGYKNMVGTFRQPEFVLCPPDLLRTLPRKGSGLRCGFAEMIKHGAIADPDHFADIEKNADAALALDGAVIERLVHDSVRIKAAIVSRDEREAGERRKLNFGHTFGHAIERLGGWTHGEAVAVGMALAADFSVKEGYLAPAHRDRLIRLIRRYGLPTGWGTAAGSPGVGIDKARVIEALGKDKKRRQEAIRFVFLREIGAATVVRTPLTSLARFLKAAG